MNSIFPELVVYPANYDPLKSVKIWHVNWIAIVIFFKRLKIGQNLFASRWNIARNNDQRIDKKLCKNEIKGSFQLSVLACWNCSILRKFHPPLFGVRAGSGGISNFRRFRKKLNSLELLNNIFENSSPKGSFGRNKRKFEFSVLSRDSQKIQSYALKIW